jgi:hypothetical protein
MQYTRRDLTVSRVAAGHPADAVAWLQRRWAWENRLAELRRHDALDDPRHGSAAPVRVAVARTSR